MLRHQWTHSAAAALILLGVFTVTLAQDGAEALAKGRELLAAKKYKDAVAMLDKAVAADPRSAEAYDLRGDAHYRLGNLDEAFADHNKSLELMPKSAQALKNRARVYTQRRKYDEAIADLEQALKIDPKYTPAYLNRGLLYLEHLNDLDRAYADIEAALKIDPKYSLALNALGTLYLRQERHREAYDQFNAAVEADPNFAEAWAKRGITLRELGSYDKAIESLTRALKVDPQNAYAAQIRGSMYYNAGRFKEAAADLEVVVQGGKAVSNVYMHLGMAYAQLKEHEKAIGAYDSHLKLEPTSYYGYYNRGNAYNELNKLDQAMADYDQALSMSVFPAVVNARAGVFLKRGEQDKALAEYERATQLLPRWAQPHRGKALVYLEQEDYEKAANSAAMAVQLQPDYAYAFETLGNALLGLGRPDDAIKSYAAAMRLDQRSPTYMASQARALIIAGRYEEALALAIKTVEKEVTFAGGYKSASVAQAHLGKIKEAIATLNTAARTARQHATEVMRAWLHLIDGDAAAAERDARNAYEGMPDKHYRPYAASVLYLALKQKGDADAAAKHLAMAVEETPQDSPFRTLLLFHAGKQEAKDVQSAALKQLMRYRSVVLALAAYDLELQGKKEDAAAMWQEAARESIPAFIESAVARYRLKSMNKSIPEYAPTRPVKDL